MSSQSSGSKRKEPDNSTFGGLLHAKWRSKRARSGSLSGSLPTSGASSPGYSHSPARSNTSSRDPSPMRDNDPLLPSHNSSYTLSNPPGILPNVADQAPQSVAGTSASTRNSKRTAWTGLEQALQKLSVATKIFPPLSSAAEDLASCLPMLETVANGRSEYDDITASLKRMVDLLSKHFNATASEEIRETIEDVARTIREEIESIKVQQSRSRSRRALGALNSEDDLMRRYRRVEQLFRQVEGEASLSTWSGVNEILVENRLKTLLPAQLARYKSTLSTEVGRRGCTEQTRTKILDDSVSWSDNRDSAKIYWMNGMAGTGKTTIAYSFCERLDIGKQLAASFFCTRASPECRDAKRIIPTLAYQLARRLAPFRYSLCQQLKKDPDIGTGQLADQFYLLLKTPLLGAKDKLPNNLVIVVDALDECSDPYIVELFLDLLFRSAGELPVKFFVTSRPEPAIRNKMMPEGEHLRSILYLHEIEESLVQEDIERYLRDELASISPADVDIQELAEHAGKLFIYAATAVRYIRPVGRSVNSKARLAAVLAVNTESKKTLSSIDTLYSAILTAAMNDVELEPEEQNRMRLVLWTAICACEPIPIGTLSTLSGLRDKDDTVAALEPLRSVLHVSESDGELVTTLHASFPDYMLSQERSGAFYCNKNEHSQGLAARCFDIMKAQLRFNICSIPSSFTSNEKTPEIGQLIDANISSELFYTCRFWTDHLVETSPQSSGILFNLLHEFLSQQLLFWMEVMSVKSCMVLGVLGTAKLTQWLGQVREDADTYSELLGLASDAQGFVAGYASSPSSAYTPHIYLSSLPLSPPSSSVRSCYLPRFRGLIKVSGKAFDRLEKATLGVWESKSPIRAAAFSPNGDRIIIGNENGRISVHNAYDGKPLVQLFKAHKKVVTSIGISTGGTQIVTGSHDMTLSIWNAYDGSLISGPFKGHTNRVTSVAFSLDDAHIASGSDDCTVGIWDPRDSNVSMRSFTGHQKGVKSVAFSPDGSHIISGSADRTIRMWDLSSGTTTLVLQGHTAIVSSVQFALAGARIVSGSGAQICIWNTSDGSLVHQILKGHSKKVTSISVSPEGDRVISGSHDRTIRVWDVNSGELIAGPLHGHTDLVRSVGFSGDGMRIMSASDDKTVRIWNVHSQDPWQQIEKPSKKTHAYTDLNPSLNQRYIAFIDHTERTKFHVYDLQTTAHITISSGVDVTLLQFSLDATRVHSLHRSGTICTWDVQMGALLDGPHRFSSSEAISERSAACSMDGARVVTCHNDKAELWHAQTNRSIAWCEIGPNSYAIFSQDGSRFLTTGYNDRVNVWDAENGARVACFPPMGGPSALSPDGTSIYNFNRNNLSLQLLNVNDGESSSIEISHASTGILLNLKFTADGLYVSGLDEPSGIKDRVYWALSTRDQKVTSTTPRLNMMGRPFLGEIIGYSSDGYFLRSSHLYDDGGGYHISRFQIRNPPSANSDGWVLDSENRQLVWVPAELRENFPTCRGVAISCGGDTLLSVDYDGMLVGDDWSKCYIGDS